MRQQANKAALRVAMGTYLDLLGTALPTEESLSAISFSETFEQRMDRLFQKERKFYFYWINTAAKRVACILVILFLAAVTTTFSVEALREPFIRFVVETFEKGSRLIFPADNEEDQPVIPLLPSYIPEGFSVVLDMTDSASVILHYENKNGQSFAFTQWVDGTTAGANTEGVPYQKILIANRYEGITFNKDDISYLFFSNGEYLFNLDGTISKDELIKIAESIPFDAPAE